MMYPSQHPLPIQSCKNFQTFTLPLKMFLAPFGLSLPIHPLKDPFVLPVYLHICLSITKKPLKQNTKGRADDQSKYFNP